MKSLRYYVIVAMLIATCLTGCTPQAPYAVIPSSVPPVAPPIASPDDGTESPSPSLQAIDEVDTSQPFEEWPASLRLTELHEEGMQIDHEGTRHISGDGWAIYIMPGYEAEVMPDGTLISNTRSIFRGCSLLIKVIDNADAREALESAVKAYELEGYVFAPDMETGDDNIQPIQAYNDWEIERHGGQYFGSVMRQDGYFAHGSIYGDEYSVYLTMFVVVGVESVALITQTQEATDENAAYSSVMPEISAMRHTFHLK